MAGDGRGRAGELILLTSYQERAPQMQFSSFYHQAANRTLEASHQELLRHGGFCCGMERTFSGPTLGSHAARVAVLMAFL